MFAKYFDVAEVTPSISFAPPLVGLEYGKPNEGSYIVVNKNLIEACALWVLYVFPTSQYIGIDRFMNNETKN